MKSYSDDTISRTELAKAVGATHDHFNASISEVDKKQSEQIKKLRIWLGFVTAVAAINAVTLAVLLSPF